MIKQEFNWTGVTDTKRVLAEELLDFISPLVENKGKSVIAIEADYGMGKTYFSQKFNEYLDHHDISSRYFSVWERDYLDDPFIAFSEFIMKKSYEVAKKTESKTKSDKIIRKAKKFWVGSKNLVKSGISSVNVSAKGKATLPGLGEVTLGAGVSGDKFIKSLESYIEDTEEKISLDSIDPIHKFKETLTELILEMPSKSLVLIVDELDRCRPDYAIKVLETIKHFYDIEGLIIILPINRRVLSRSIEGFYNLPSDLFESKEHYLERFFNIAIPLPETSYIDFIRKAIVFYISDNMSFYNKLLETGKIVNNGSSEINDLSSIGKNSEMLVKSLSGKSVRPQDRKDESFSHILSCREIEKIINTFFVLIGRLVKLNTPIYLELLLVSVIDDYKSSRYGKDVTQYLYYRDIIKKEASGYVEEVDKVLDYIRKYSFDPYGIEEMYSDISDNHLHKIDEEYYQNAYNLKMERKRESNQRYADNMRSLSQAFR
jgi:hypothetical protein